MIERHYTRSTLGFRTSFNKEAEDIENYLGLEFQDKPIKIKIGLRNTIALPLHVFDGSKFFEIAKYFLFAWGDKNILGLYMPEYNAYLYRFEDPFVARHENIHAAIDQHNSSIRALSETIYRENRDTAIQGDLTRLASNSETAAIYQCFIEGTAQWGAITIGLQTGSEIDRATATRQHNMMMINREDVNFLTTSSKFAKKSIKEVQEAVGELKKAFTKLDSDFPDRVEGGRLSFKFMKALTRTFIDVVPQRARIMHASYSSGYYFTYFAIREMEAGGMNKREALLRLIDNPPTFLDNLQDPVAYAKSLLKSR